MDFRYNMHVFKPFFVVRKSNSCNSNGVYSRKPTKTLKTMVWKRNPLVTMGMCWCFLLVVVVVKYANSHVLPLFSMSTKVIKTAHAKAHFLDAILSQSNGVVLNFVHELCSCKANCITGGSFFRITIDMNYST